MFVFIESVAFDRVRDRYLDDDEYSELQQFMMQSPEAGAIVRGSGGVRKLRWRRAGTGKRGGFARDLFRAISRMSSGCWHYMPRRSRRMRPPIF